MSESGSETAGKTPGRNLGDTTTGDTTTGNTARTARCPGLAGFPITVDIPVAWGDMDAFGHVNNTVFFRWFESARIAFLEAVGFTSGGEAVEGNAGEADAVGPILGSTSCRFRRPVVFPDTVTVGVRTVSVEEDRFTHAYRVVSRGLGEVVAEGEGVVVSYDYAAKRKAAIPVAVRAAIDGLAMEGS